MVGMKENRSRAVREHRNTYKRDRYNSGGLVEGDLNDNYANPLIKPFAHNCLY